MKLMIVGAGQTTCVFCDFAEDGNPEALPAEWELTLETVDLDKVMNNVDLDDLEAWTIEEGWTWMELPATLLTGAKKQPLSLAERINLQNEMAYTDIEIELGSQKKVA